MNAPTQIAQRQHVLGRLAYSPSKAVRLWRRVVGVLAIAFGLVQLAAASRSLLPQHVYGKDFLQGYAMARAILHRVDPYLPTDVLAERFWGQVPFAAWPHPTPQPPTLGTLLVPLALLDYPTAATVWFGLEMVCLVASVYLLGRALGARLSIWTTLGVATALLIWYPVQVEMFMGQLQLLVLALLAGAWVALRSGRPALGGALLGLAILVKPIPLPLLLLLVVRKDWRALTGAVPVILGGYLVAGCVVGFETLVTYLTKVLPLVQGIYRAALGNMSLWSVGWRIFDGTRSQLSSGIVAPPLVRSPVAAQVVSIALSSLLLLVAALAVRKQRSPDVSLGVMICVSILISPLSWPHYLVLAIIPAAHVVRWLLWHRLPSRETNLALLVAVLLAAHWLGLASLVIRAAGSYGGVAVVFAVAQLPLMPAVAVGALGWLVLWLAPLGNSTSATMQS